MKSFDALGLSGELVEAVRQLGFETPTPIQEQAIPCLITGKYRFSRPCADWNRKTAAFGLPLIQVGGRLKSFYPGPDCCPYRELSVQITDDLERFAKSVKNLNIVSHLWWSEHQRADQKSKKEERTLLWLLRVA